MKRSSWLRFDAPEQARSSVARRRLACEKVESRQLLDGSGVIIEATIDDPLIDEVVIVEPPLYLQAENGNFIFNSQSFDDPVLQLPHRFNSPLRGETSFDPFTLKSARGEQDDPAQLTNNAGEVDITSADSFPTRPSGLSSLNINQANLTQLNYTQKTSDDVDITSAADPYFTLEASQPNHDLPLTSLLPQNASLLSDKLEVSSFIGPQASRSASSTTAQNAASTKLIDLIFGSSLAHAQPGQSITTTQQQTPELQRLPVTPANESAHVEPSRTVNASPQFIDISQTFVHEDRSRISVASQENLVRLRNEAAVADERRLASVATMGSVEAEPRRGIIRAFETSHGPDRVYTRRTREVSPALEIASADGSRRLSPEIGATNNRRTLSDPRFSSSEYALSNVDASRFAMDSRLQAWVEYSDSIAHAPITSISASDNTTVWHEAWQWLTDQCFSLANQGRRSVAQTGVVIIASIAALAYYPRNPETIEDQPPRLSRSKPNRHKQ